MNEDVPTGYDDAALDGFAAKAREWRKRGDAYIFMINGAKVRAPAAALALQDKLGSLICVKPVLVLGAPRNDAA